MQLRDKKPRIEYRQPDSTPRYDQPQCLLPRFYRAHAGVTGLGKVLSDF